MADPTDISPQHRASTRALAAKIVESVRADERMPHGLLTYLHRIVGETYKAGEVEDLLLRLSLEIETLHAQFGEALDLTSTPEHAQDDEWNAKQRELMAAWRGEE